MKAMVVCFLIGVCVFQNINAQLIVQYGSFKFDDPKNDTQVIETKIEELLKSEYPNIKKSEEFNSIFSSHTNISGLPSTSDIYGKNSPTEITAILLEKDVLSNSQVARESVRILNNLISEHGYTFPKESYTGYQVKAIIEGTNIKVCLFINSYN
jgi:hypothetical protein